MPTPTVAPTNMGLPPELLPQDFLLKQLESARRQASDMNQRGVQVSVDIGKERMQFFEKIALAAGGTIALVVSFVGAHASRLQPPWLLRSSLVTLVLSLVGATYRNWRFPYYLLANYNRQYLEAKRESMRRETEYVRAANAIPIADTRAVSLTEYDQQVVEDEKIFEEKITECKRQEEMSFKTVQIIEYVTLSLLILGMGMLVGLAWRNF